MAGSRWDALCAMEKRRKDMANITNPGTGDMAGFPVLAINLSKLWQYVNAGISRSVTYVFGEKDPHPGAWPIDYAGIDCSGFALTALAYATTGATIGHMPDGSMAQNAWCKAAGFKHHVITCDQDYIDAVSSADHHVRLCFHAQNGRDGDSIGHVWYALTKPGTGVIVSAESHGGKGIDCRSVLWSWFVHQCTDVYVLA
jgi:hypothetical protein